MEPWYIGTARWREVVDHIEAMVAGLHNDYKSICSFLEFSWRCELRMPDWKISLFFLPSPLKDKFIPPSASDIHHRRWLDCQQSQRLLQNCQEGGLARDILDRFQSSQQICCYLTGKSIVSSFETWAKSEQCPVVDSLISLNRRLTWDMINSGQQLFIATATRISSTTSSMPTMHNCISHPGCPIYQ